MPNDISDPYGYSLRFAHYLDLAATKYADTAVVPFDETLGYFSARDYVANVLRLRPEHLGFQIANGLVTPEGLAENIKILGTIAAQSSVDPLVLGSAECIADAARHIAKTLGGFRHRKPSGLNINETIEWHLNDWLGIKADDARPAANPLWISELLEAAPAVVRAFVKNAKVGNAELFLHDLLGYRPENAFATERSEVTHVIALLAELSTKTVSGPNLPLHAGTYVLCLSSLRPEIIDTIHPANTRNAARFLASDFMPGPVIELVNLYLAIQDSPAHMKSFADALSSRDEDCVKSKQSVTAFLELIDAYRAMDMGLYQQKFEGLLVALGYRDPSASEPARLPNPPARLAQAKL